MSGGVYCYHRCFSRRRAQTQDEEEGRRQDERRPLLERLHLRQQLAQRPLPAQVEMHEIGGSSAHRASFGHDQEETTYDSSRQTNPIYRRPRSAPPSCVGARPRPMHPPSVAPPAPPPSVSSTGLEVKSIIQI